MIEITETRPPWRAADLCVFDVQVGPSLRIFNLALRRMPNGFHRIMPPNACGKHAVSFAPPLAIEITKAVLAKIEGHPAYAEFNRAA
ncbi:hypothetical protein QBK93_17380 [Rhizobium leguminosarum]|uniref:hypothetical protein n=1 Tax=Rhizobium leguminosarum TaxID=384 RepID=UPI0024A9B0D0|nr:hypothetical protein [Rhizobium leguminosarum]MDI5926451.1 hypothetical protein [Rhizobium leguminosarum]